MVYMYEYLTELYDLFATLLWRCQFLLPMTEGTEQEHALWTATGLMRVGRRKWNCNVGHRVKVSRYIDST